MGQETNLLPGAGGRAAQLPAQLLAQAHAPGLILNELQGCSQELGGRGEEAGVPLPLARALPTPMCPGMLLGRAAGMAVSPLPSPALFSPALHNSVCSLFSPSVCDTPRMLYLKHMLLPLCRVQGALGSS